ncbi:MAG: hypothetical protein K2P81_08035 [Bacteriovoracaceae bacterium]|nr:hypothetical protein [Bacteriovoracaceae bacterium]
MLERKPTSNPGKALPQEWLESVSLVLNETYAEQCVAHKRQFDVFGRLYPQELLVIIGFLPKESTNESAVSCFLSCDFQEIETPQKVKETQANFMDVAGLFYDEYFANSEWSDWEPQWQEVEWKGKKYFYKMTRENIRLTLEADRLLREAGFDPNEDIIEDEDEDKTLH